MRQFQLPVSDSQLCFHDNQCWSPEKEVRYLKNYSTLIKYVRYAYTPQTPSISNCKNTAQSMIENTSWYQLLLLTWANFKEKECIFLHPSIWEWGRRAVLLFQNEDGDRQRYCAKNMLLFLQENIIYFCIWCHFAKKKKSTMPSWKSDSVADRRLNGWRRQHSVCTEMQG